MSLDTLARATAKKQIAKYGKTVTVIRVTEGVYDVATSTTTNTEVSEDIKALVEEANGREFVNVETNDKKLTVSASAVDELLPSDKLIVADIGYVIKSIKTVYGGELAALYIIHATKA